MAATALLRRLSCAKTAYEYVAPKVSPAGVYDVGVVSVQVTMVQLIVPLPLTGNGGGVAPGALQIVTPVKPGSVGMVQARVIELAVTAVVTMSVTGPVFARAVVVLVTMRAVE